MFFHLTSFRTLSLIVHGLKINSPKYRGVCLFRGFCFCFIFLTLILLMVSEIPGSMVCCLTLIWKFSHSYCLKYFLWSFLFFFYFSGQFSHSVMSAFLRSRGLQYTRLPCPSPTPGAYSNSCPLNRWCHPTISSSVIPFSYCLQSFPGSGSFQMSQLFPSGGQSIGVSALASVLPMNIRDWFPLEWTGWSSLLSKGLSRVFSNTTVQKHQFFSAQLSLWSNSHIDTWLLEKP